MKLIFFLGLLLTIGWGVVMGVERLLVVDDLAQCPQPVLVDSTCRPANAIVAVSGGDTSARAAEAIRLYQTGWAPTLVFSGAAQDKSGPSNGEAMRRLAVRAGVPEDAVIVEGGSIDTAENALRSSALIGSAERLIVVTSPYHQRRAGLEFQHVFGRRVTILNHPTPTDRLWPAYWWTTTNGWSLALTEVLKTLFVMLVPR